MTHLRIEQNNIPENVSAHLLEAIYNYAFRGDLDNSSNFSGSLTALHGYQEHANWLCNKYQDLSINIQSPYILFKDQKVEQLCSLAWGDGVGITQAQAYGQSGKLDTVFENNEDITSFDEFQYFRFNDFSWGYWTKGCFANCTNLKSITLPNTVSNIQNALFYNCNNLETVTTTRSVESIGWSGFNSCYKLKNVDLSEVTSIGNWGFCKDRELDVSQCGLDFTKITSLGEHAFDEVKGVGDVELPLCSGSLARVFTECNSITSIKNTPLITEISGVDSGWNGAFSWMEELDTLDLSLATQVTSIARGFVRNCPMLRIIKLPNTITSITTLQFLELTNDISSYHGSNYRNFYGNLKALVLPCTTPPTPIDSQYGTDDLTLYTNLSIYVPDASVNSYKTAQFWSTVASKFKPLSQFATDFPND